MNLDAHIPSGPMAQKWDKHRFDLKLVNPANKRKYEVIVVGSGLAGASAAASLADGAVCVSRIDRRGGIGILTTQNQIVLELAGL